jgi:hypothetical protein
MGCLSFSAGLATYQQAHHHHHDQSWLHCSQLLPLVLVYPEVGSWQWYRYLGCIADGYQNNG